MIENEIYTGAVRRIDDLNRVTIPKDICIKANIKSGDPFEVYYTKEGDIILRPYDEYRLERENIKKADKVLQTLNNRINIIVFDKNNVIYSSTGRATAPINNYKITQAMEGNEIEGRKSFSKSARRTCNRNSHFYGARCRHSRF